MEICVKKEPVDADDLDEVGPSMANKLQNGMSYSLREREEHLHGSSEANAGKVGPMFVKKHLGLSRRKSPFSGWHSGGFGVALKEEHLSDEEVVDVYPTDVEVTRHGAEVTRHGTEVQTVGCHPIYSGRSNNSMGQNRVLTKRHGMFRFDGQEGSAASFERLSYDIFVEPDGTGHADDARYPEKRRSHENSYHKPVISCVRNDERGASFVDFGCQIDNSYGDDIGENCAEAEDTEESYYVYFDENQGREGDRCEPNGIASREGDLRCIVSARMDELEGTCVSSRAAILGRPAGKVSTPGEQFYYEVDASDSDERASDQSLYEPSSSNESDSDDKDPDYGSLPKHKRSISQKKSSAHSKEGKPAGLSDGWKVNENRCMKCHCCFTMRKDLDSHTCTVTNISCNICGKRVKDFDALQRHEKVHLEVKPYTCEICGKGFREKGNLTTHKRTHTKETPFECEHCQKRFADPSNFNRHRKSHLGLAVAKPCQCKFCGERFSRTANLLRHLVRFHKGEKEVLEDDLEIGTEAEIPTKFKKLACSFCGKMFGKKEILQTHELLHEECKALSCKHCRRLLSSKDGLLQHLKIHGVQVDGTARKAYVCSYCGASFQRKLSLTGHERTHTKEWLHTCPICNRRFTLKTSLTRHLLTHSGKKPHGCDICEKRFLRAYDLTVHKRIHSKERPYVCDSCGHGFAAQTNFSKHAKKCKAKADAV